MAVSSSGGLRRSLERLGAGPFGPVKVAVALALPSSLLVAASFLLPPVFEVDANFQPPSLAGAVIVGLVACLGAAAAGGAIGGVMVRRHPTLGGILALAIAWPVAVSLLSIAAKVAGVTFEAAYSCFDTCGPMVNDDDALSGLGAYLISAFVSMVTIVPIVIAGVCVFGAYKLNASGSPFAASIVLAIGYASLHFMTLLGGAAPLVAYVCLLVGVALWTAALRGPSLRQVTGATA